MTATCPNGITTRISAHGYATFGAKCRGCPLRQRCTTARDGRTVKINQHHDLLAAARAHALTPAFTEPYRQHRPMVERSIAWLVRRGGRKVRYRGIARNHIGLAHRCAADQPATTHQPRHSTGTTAGPSPPETSGPGADNEGTTPSAFSHPARPTLTLEHRLFGRS